MQRHNYCHQELYKSQHQSPEPRASDSSTRFSQIVGTVWTLLLSWETWHYNKLLCHPLRTIVRIQQGKDMKAVWKGTSGRAIPSIQSSHAQLEGSLAKLTCLLQVLQPGGNLHIALAQDVHPTPFLLPTYVHIQPAKLASVTISIPPDPNWSILVSSQNCYSRVSGLSPQKGTIFP